MLTLILTLPIVIERKPFRTEQKEIKRLATKIVSWICKVNIITKLKANWGKASKATSNIDINELREKNDFNLNLCRSTPSYLSLDICSFSGLRTFRKNLQAVNGKKVTGPVKNMKKANGKFLS